eukprot:6491870-Amphidinium_carterae.2
MKLHVNDSKGCLTRERSWMQMNTHTPTQGCMTCVRRGGGESLLVRVYLIFACKAERGHLATFRFHMKGQKRCIIVDEAAAMSFFRGKTANHHATFGQCWEYVRAKMCADPQLLSQFLSMHGQGKVWHASLQESDVLYVPAGMIVVESISGVKICSGVKWAVIGPSDHSCLAPILAHLESLTAKGASIALLKSAVQLSMELQAGNCIIFTVPPETSEQHAHQQAAWQSIPTFITLAIATVDSICVAPSTRPPFRAQVCLLKTIGTIPIFANFGCSFDKKKDMFLYSQIVGCCH